MKVIYSQFVLVSAPDFLSILICIPVEAERKSASPRTLEIRDNEQGTLLALED
jgi:hypothetical protein